MKRLLRDLAMARTVSRRQLWARVKKTGHRLSYPIRARLQKGQRSARDSALALTPESAAKVADAGGILAHLRSRSAPRWFPGPEVAEREPSVFPGESAECLAIAEEAVAGRYGFLNASAELGHPPDWLSSGRGGKEWTYLLNRFHYLVDLGRAYRYTRREEFCKVGIELVGDWIEQNPVGHPVTWESVSCAWRIENWLAACLHFLPSPQLSEPWLRGMLTSVALQAEHLRAHIEYDLAGNHLLFEAKGLIVAGIMLPEIRGSSTWLRDGLALLRHEAARQVLPDGGHGEFATHYHVEITLLLTEVVLLLRMNDLEIPPELLSVLKRMYRFLMWITKPDGHIPMLGDSVRDEPIEASVLLGLGALLLGHRELARLARGGAKLDRLMGAGASVVMRERRAPGFEELSRVFPSSGYVVARSGWGRDSDYVVWDCGPFGMRAGPGHGHVDALSFELVLGGETVIIDPGVYQYEEGVWRDFFRGVAAHNSIRVEETEPCVLWGAYRVVHPPRVRLLGWVTSTDTSFGEAEHDGYQRVGLAVVHRRLLAWLHQQVWLVTDWLYPSDTRLQWEAHFHFSPGARLVCEGGRFRAVLVGGTEVEGLVLGSVASIGVVEGQREPPQGWVSYDFGHKVAAPVLRVVGNCVGRPLLTLVARKGELGGWELTECEDGGAVLAGQSDARRLVVGMGGPQAPRLRTGPLDTDARTALLEWGRNGLTRILLADSRYLTWEGEPLVRARRKAGVICWRKDGDTGVLSASPGTVLRLELGIPTVPSGGGIRLRNGGDFCFPVRGSDD
jgi:uncharacterized heparinase superfamily protein